jgi:hypothetical protein
VAPRDERIARTNGGGAQPQRKRCARSTRLTLWRLSNFWFGMSLLGVWGFMTLIGVIVDQGKDADFYLRNYSPPLARLVLRLHLDNIYHSPPTSASWASSSCCMTLATFRRVIPTRLPPLRAVKIDAMPLAAQFTVRGDEASVRERVERFFSEGGWLVRKRELAASSGRSRTSTTGRGAACSSRTSASSSSRRDDAVLGVRLQRPDRRS